MQPCHRILLTFMRSSLPTTEKKQKQAPEHHATIHAYKITLISSSDPTDLQQHSRLFDLEWLFRNLTNMLTCRSIHDRDRAQRRALSDPFALLRDHFHVTQERFLYRILDILPAIIHSKVNAKSRILIKRLALWP